MQNLQINLFGSKVRIENNNIKKVYTSLFYKLPFIGPYLGRLNILIITL